MAGPVFRAHLTGLDELIRDLADRPDEVRIAVAGALLIEGEKIMTAAKHLTPVDEGILRASGHVQPPDTEGDIIEVEMGFGGPAGSGVGQTKDVGYAVYVHEDLTAHHPVGQAKFLEVPFNQAKAGLVSRVVDRVRRRMSR